MSHKNMLEYGKPEIVDYGDLKELTEACQGTGVDGGGLVGLATADQYNTSRIHCVTTGH